MPVLSGNRHAVTAYAAERLFCRLPDGGLHRRRLLSVLRMLAYGWQILTLEGREARGASFLTEKSRNKRLWMIIKNLNEICQNA